MPAAEAETTTSQNTGIQPSQLLTSLFSHLEEEQRITVLHVGPALQDTVSFFSNFRCKLHFCDLFAELPILTEEETAVSLRSRFKALLDFEEETRFDICLFWDVFNYLEWDAVNAFMAALRPHLTRMTRAHAFALHNIRSQRSDYLYSIVDVETIRAKNRSQPLPGYAPHTQRKLKDLLYNFKFERSVLLEDSRLELLLRAKV